jgi:transcription termination factor NusB
MTAPARAAAFRALTAIAANHRDLPTALVESRRRLTDERDRSLAAAIVHGTLRWQRACDYLIEGVSERPLESLDRDVLVILRLSLYQIQHLDRVPSAAVVDDAVSLTRTAGKRSATGFVNAVLRTTLRQRRALPFPARPEDPTNREAALRYLGITWSHPGWLVARWLDRVGFERAEEWVRFNNDQAPLTLSVNRLRATRESVRTSLGAEGIECEDTRFAPHGLRVVTGNPLRRPEHDQFLVQDEASQLVPLAVDAQTGERTLDLCGAPGGKTVIMSGDMGDTARRFDKPACTMLTPYTSPQMEHCLLPTCSIACSSMLHARGWVRFGAIPTSSGADTNLTWPASPIDSLLSCIALRASCVTAVAWCTRRARASRKRTRRSSSASWSPPLASDSSTFGVRAGRS